MLVLLGISLETGARLRFSKMESELKRFGISSLPPQKLTSFNKPILL
ncbi:hypothetical protein T03_1537 [Trichinella britovi]|uniref:Uncharacterized protein n=1 Tax=Trichinella britovi TaxID=45882 RepID=A0A0V1AIF8_TRIBR|nr:hypothetical protein T03_1537 [Trichinella britovi]